VTVELEKWESRVPLLMDVPARIRFISCEPLLGPIRLKWLHAIAWVIIGGESEQGARRMDPQWALSIIEQCRLFRVACFFKQTGTVLAREWRLKHPKGEDISELPPEFRIREFPQDDGVRPENRDRP
jgi:protein gp37